MLQPWGTIITHLDFALQPIVSVHAGTCIGVEALLRNYEKAGFSSIQEVFEKAWQDQYLYHLELQLREKAIQKFCLLPFAHQVKLFFNIDTRVVSMPDYQPGNTLHILEKYHLKASQVVFEISEQHRVSSFHHLQRVLEQYRQQGFQIALDDYGIGFSGLQLLYYCEPEYIKIPRFFVEGLARDQRKKLFLSNLVSISHTLGIQIIGEGIETEQDFYEGWGIGFDFVQGFLIQKPTREPETLQERYSLVVSLHRANRRHRKEDTPLILANLEKIPAISVHDSPIQACEVFRVNPQYHLLPVVDKESKPVGIITEQDLRKILYSRYGHALLENPTLQSVEPFLIPCPVF